MINLCVLGCPPLPPPYIKELGGRPPARRRARQGGSPRPTSSGTPPFLVGVGEGGRRRDGVRKGGRDTSILHHAFISILIALWVVTTHYISILIAILSYFTRFTMKRGNAGSWNFGWKRSKRWKPILHNSKSPETPRNNFLEFIRISERKK